MAKTQTHYVCQNCGYSTPKWLGKCPECGKWDTLVEETAVPAPSRQRPSYLAVTESPTPKTLKQVEKVKVRRMTTGIHEFDRVLGGGIVPGSLILLGGAPGIGKSTITLDVSMKAAASGERVLYVSGEESEAQTAMRAERLGQATDALQIMTATELGTILVQAKQVNPRLLVIDSIQTMYNQELESAAGSVGQVRECTAKLLTFAKETGIAVIIIGHVTKEGNIAGPRLLEHMVDVVLQFEGDRSYTYRVLRALKNRFGSTSECGIFSMEEEGLREVANPSGLFLEAKEEAVSGSVITAAMADPHRNPGPGFPYSLWLAPEDRGGSGFQPGEYAAGGAGKALRHEFWRPGCLCVRGRRYENQGTGGGPGHPGVLGFQLSEPSGAHGGAGHRGSGPYG